MDDLLVRYIFLSRCIYLGTFNAVSRTILFKHRIWNSEFEVMHFTSFNLSPNRLLHSQQHLYSCTLIVKAIPHSKPEHQWKFSSRLESSHNIMSRTNREQSSRAMATTVMKFKGQFKNIWAPPQKNRKYIFIFR